MVRGSGALAMETYHSVEAGAFVALRPPLGVLGLAGAELAEVFGGFGDDVGEEFHFDAAEGFACGLLVAIFEEGLLSFDIVTKDAMIVISGAKSCTEMPRLCKLLYIVNAMGYCGMDYLQPHEKGLDIGSRA